MIGMRIWAVSQCSDEFEYGLAELMMSSVIELNAKVILETGTNKGDSARIWSMALSWTGGQLWTVDIDLPMFDLHLPNAYAIRCDSLALQWDKPIDILHLDSNHVYPHPKLELMKFAPFVRKGGRIFIHDYLDKGSQPGGGADIRRATEEWAKETGHEIAVYPPIMGPKTYGFGIINIL